MVGNKPLVAFSRACRDIDTAVVQATMASVIQQIHSRLHWFKVSLAHALCAMSTLQYDGTKGTCAWERLC